MAWWLTLIFVITGLIVAYVFAMWLYEFFKDLFGDEAYKWRQE